MNLENMKTFRAQLGELNESQFDMRKWIAPAGTLAHEFLTNARMKQNRETDCGTVACAAGWCCLLNGGPKSMVSLDLYDWAKEWLGLTDSQAYGLFLWGNNEKAMRYVTLADVQKAVDELIKEAERGHNH